MAPSALSSSAALSPVELGREACSGKHWRSRLRRGVSSERAAARSGESSASEAEGLRGSGSGLSQESPALEPQVQGDAGRLRVVRDTKSLLTVAELQVGARLEKLPVTGIKNLVDRLAPCFMTGGVDRPTTKQLRYVLYIHARRAQCKIKYESIRRKHVVSEWIASWKV